MKISDRLTDYVVIGGFFWITQCVVLFVVGFGHIDWTSQLGNFHALIARIPDKALGPLVALLGAFGLVTVFTTGVFLDLLGSSYFRPIELNAFQTHAKKNALWMQGFIRRYEDYIQDDWLMVLRSPGYKEFFRVALKGVRFWNKKARAEYVDAVKKRLSGRKSYTRMHSFLLSWISLVGGADKIELLNTQLSFWSISRAIAMALALASLEAPFLYGIFSSFWTRFANPSDALLIFLYLMQCALLLAALGVSRAAYSRVCGTMFALCYIADEKSKGPLEIPR